MGNDMKKVSAFGGQFPPAKGGQFASATGGQFKLESGGQFHRFSHCILIVQRTCCYKLMEQRLMPTTQSFCADEKKCIFL